MRYTFSSCAFTTIDFRGFDPSTLTDLFYTFSWCNKLTTILADASWALPSSGITGSQCFYSCSTSLVGGRHRMGEQQDGVHVLPHRHSKHVRVHHGCIAF